MVAHLELLSRARYRVDLLTLCMFLGENQLRVIFAVCIPPRVESLVALYTHNRRWVGARDGTYPQRAPCFVSSMEHSG